MVIKKSPSKDVVKSSMKKYIPFAVLAVMAVSVVAFMRLQNTKEDTVDEVTETASQTSPTSAPVLESWALTDEQTRLSGQDQPIVGAVISNAPDARPQSGLHAADVVFETIAEAGITRFVTFWQSEQPELIGPVRSLRPYFSDFAMSIDAPIAHVGGSLEAIEEAPSLAVKNMDQFFSGGSFERTTDREAPHNVYTDFTRLNALSADFGYQDSSFEGFDAERVATDSPAQIRSVTANFSTALYNPTFIYNEPANFYTRTIEGQPHTDRETGNEVGAENVLALNMAASIDPDGRYIFTTVGTGTGTLFNAGTTQVLTWSKSSRSAAFEFTNAAGESVNFQPGATWVLVMPPGKSVTY